MTPIYLLTGPNFVFRREYCEDLLKDIPKEEISVYYADETDSWNIFNQCIQNSLFGQNQVVWVRNIDAIKPKPLPTDLGQSYANMKDAFRERCLNYIEDPNPNTVLILEWEKPPAIIISKANNNPNVSVHNFKRVYRRDIINYVIEHFSRKGVQCDRSVADLIVSITNENLEETSMMLKMLIDYIGESKEITYRDVTQALSRSHNLSVFDLIDALFTRKKEKALIALNDMKLNSDPHITVINKLILRSAQLLWAYLTMKGDTALSEKLGIRYYEMKKLAEYSHYSNLRYVSSVLEMVREVEYLIKSTSEDFAYMAIENFILAIQD